MQMVFYTFLWRVVNVIVTCMLSSVMLQNIKSRIVMWKCFVSKWELAKFELHLHLRLAASNKLAPIGMIEHHLLIIKLDVDLWQWSRSRLVFHLYDSRCLICVSIPQFYYLTHWSTIILFQYFFIIKSDIVCC